MSKSFVIIPALNPDKAMIGYIETLLASGIPGIIVVDDGSSKNYQDVFHKIANMDKVTLIVHKENKGKGRSLKDALQYYQENGLDKKYNGVITADADGQHSVADVLKISELLETGRYQDTLILGERAFDKDVPLRSRFGNSCTRTIFRLLYRLKLHDTQTGLRGIPNALISEFADIYGERYEYEMNMLITCSINKIPLKSVTIETIYLDDNSSSHFNVMRDSFKIYKLLFKSFFKFMLASLSSFVVDVILFSIIVALLKGKTEYYIIFSTVGARVCSSVYNFMINRNVVFKSNENIGKAAVKYYSLCIFQMLASATLVTLLCSYFPVIETVWKVIVDSVLFFISYSIQQRWIFRMNTRG